mgnify:CR=1 FL=1
MKKITSKHFELKRSGEGKNVNVDFVANVKSHTAPEIAESFTDDDGDVQHILTNGNTLSENNYIKHWGKPKGVINWQAKPVKENPNKFTKT